MKRGDQHARPDPTAVFSCYLIRAQVICGDASAGERLQRRDFRALTSGFSEKKRIPLSRKPDRGMRFRFRPVVSAIEASLTLHF